MAAISSVTFPAGAVFASTLSSTTRKTGVACIDGMACYGGLKAQNAVSSLGVPICADKAFSMAVNSIKPSPQKKKKKKSRGGAMSATCNAAAEIFKIAAIMNALVLIGVAVGFVLLRVESALEETE